MNSKITFSIFLFFLSMFSKLLFSQTTITIEDMNQENAFGNKFFAHIDKTNSMINIGNTNANTWDFSNLKMDESYTYNVVSPVGTPFRPDYPNSHFAYEILIGESANPNWEYYCHSATMVHLHGLVFHSESTGQVNKFIYNPVKIFAFLPMTHSTTWKDSVIENQKVENNGTLISSNNFSIKSNALVDAYGQLTLPGGKIVDALRAKITQTKTGNSFSEVKTIYRWYAKTGETIELVKNPASPEHGLINVDGDIKWITVSSVTDVADDEQKIPKNFELNQNYPNPFNPTTSIQYSVSENSFVEVKVFSTIGKEVATLVSERKAAGVYTTTFNASGLTSGIYFVKMTAGNFSSVMKMTLLK